jgi:redox-sensitive bicupin YhaK (pirin superfamily)
MPTIRRIRKVLKSRPTLEGAGVHLKRAFGWHHVPELDPFLLLDDFHSSHPVEYLPGFPWHPHRGIETITYVLEGRVEHGDSMGNRGVISPGEIQWMTAGSGIIHQEMPKGRTDGLLWGFQLWANLPASHKMMAPRYRGIEAGEIPEVTVRRGARIRIISGDVDGVRGPVEDVVTEPEYLDVDLHAGNVFRRRVRRGHTAFAYMIDGSALFGEDGDPLDYEVEGRAWYDMKRERLIGPESLVIFADGDELVASAGESGARFLLVSGKPIGEPVAWWGPIVMNTQEELRVAFEEYEQGTFLKHAKK